MSMSKRSAVAGGRAGALVLAAVVGVLGGCEMNPTTGRRQVIALSWQQEAALGVQESPKMVQEFGGEVAKQELRDYVREVGMKLAAQAVQDDARLKDLPWEFTLLNSDVVNAFALPGGKVFMSRGLAEKMTNEAELAGVLGHEIGHVAARHTNERIAQTQYAQVGVGLAGLLGGQEYGQLAQAVSEQGAQFWLLSYSRDQESEADHLGLRYMTRAKYDPRGQVQVMQILNSLDKSGRPPEMLSTHPYPEERIKNMQQAIQESYSFTQNNPEYGLHESEFRSRFLSRLGAAFPGGYDTSDAVRRLAMTGMHAGD
ncbi:MAG: M48 family metallopeptidase [Phycisphaerales bacterium]